MHSSDTALRVELERAIAAVDRAERLLALRTARLERVLARTGGGAVDPAVALVEVQPHERATDASARAREIEP